jgi:hypothetical protein
MPARQNGGPDGRGGAVAGSGRSPASTKRGQKHRQGIVAMSGSDDSTTLATALIRPHIDIVNLVLRSALLRASRRTATGEIAPAPSFETPCFARLLRMRSVD